VHPVLLHTDWVRLPTYFTCLMVGFALASFVLRREALRRGLPTREVIDLALWVVPLALIGSRVAHLVFVDPTTWRTHPAALITGGGFVFYGGAFGGLAAIAGWSWRTGRSPWVYGDCLAPATAFGLAWGRLGCLGGGCCYGKPIAWPFGVQLPWGIRYTRAPGIPDDLLGVPLHPAPLYASATALSLFVALSWLASRQRFDGQITAAFLLGYGTVRIALEVVRNDVSRGLYLGGWVSTSQAISAVAIAAGIALWRWRSGAGIVQR
jgi:phosphatidylglycerol:prolipoprotein diacylglycerol transferase